MRNVVRSSAAGGSALNVKRNMQPIRLITAALRESVAVFVVNTFGAQGGKLTVCQ
jgi:hypothetical protein